MSYLYVSEQGAVIKAEGGYFIVSYKGGMIQKIPSETLEYIAVFGNVQLTTQAIRKCFQKGVIVNFFSTNGRYFGRLDSTNNCNIFRQRRQFVESGNKPFCMEISKRIIIAKIHNQRVILQRYIKEKTPELTEALKQIKNAESKINSCIGLDEIKGYEGIACLLYTSMQYGHFRYTEFHLYHCYIKNLEKFKSQILLSGNYDGAYCR